ncbi:MULTISPECIES: hypothetical protein [unclassified Streptomyces]|uniref:hypothetical protein n=1 Tax=unclassified Streptomyces TaxID=2593676 RepID=UPI001BECC464|nr:MULTISPECIES: hypothetical protein [unclassified Streptomyces]MBT2408091.1 hypothetical protein [Streptomyces sp. ISL-21]MBT2455791.1 hypothetical protein [Streptomyces sp. ISL-86]MBT2609541.1 hypothetical protein [Streptomyces sp. ISL-87]
MSKPDDLLVAIAAAVESEQTNQMSLTVLVQGAVITGRLAPESVWRRRVAEVLKDSDRLGPFAAIFMDAETAALSPRSAQPSYLHFHVARILQGTVGIPETGGMYRIAIKDVSAWTMGDFSYSEH